MQDLASTCDSGPICATRPGTRGQSSALHDQAGLIGRVVGIPVVTCELGRHREVGGDDDVVGRVASEWTSRSRPGGGDGGLPSLVRRPLPGGHGEGGEGGDLRGGDEQQVGEVGAAEQGLAGQQPAEDEGGEVDRGEQQPDGEPAARRPCRRPATIIQRAVFAGHPEGGGRRAVRQAAGRLAGLGGGQWNATSGRIRCSTSSSGARPSLTKA